MTTIGEQHVARRTHRLYRARLHGPRHGEEHRREGLTADRDGSPQPRPHRGRGAARRKGSEDAARGRRSLDDRLSLRHRLAPGRGPGARAGRAEERRPQRCDHRRLLDLGADLDPRAVALAEELGAQGVTLVDAPLARTPKEAWEGTLDTMVGCDEATLTRLKPVLETWAGRI